MIEYRVEQWSESTKQWFAPSERIYTDYKEATKAEVAYCTWYLLENIPITRIAGREVTDWRRVSS